MRKIKANRKFKRILNEKKIPYEIKKQISYLNSKGKISYFYIDFFIDNNLAVFIENKMNTRKIVKIVDEYHDLILQKLSIPVLRIKSWDVESRDKKLFIERLSKLIIKKRLICDSTRMY